MTIVECLHGRYEMPDTLQNIKLPANTWVDLYAQSGLTVGSRLSIENLSGVDVKYHTGQVQPSAEEAKSDENGSFRRIKSFSNFINDSGDSGLWAYCHGGGLVNVLPHINDKVDAGLQTTAFNAVHTESDTPQVQMKAVYGLGHKTFRFNIVGGTTIAEDSLFKSKCGAGANALSTIVSRRFMNYRAGQGARCEFTAMFEAGVVGNQQAAGMLTATDLIGFGYSGADFGIIYSHGGTLEIQELTLSTGATGSETATVTVSGTAYSVSITSGTTEHNAYEIATDLNSQSPDYQFTSNGSDVVATSLLDGVAGSFAFSSATATASWLQVAASSAPIDEFFAQADWNVDPMPNLNPLNLNVYKVQIQYLGAGNLKLSVENENTGVYDLVHIVKLANKLQATSFANPAFRLGWASRNTTNTTAIEVSGGSCAGFIEGKVVPTDGTIPLSNVITALDTTEINALTIRNRITLDSKRNRLELIMKDLTAFTESTKGAVLRIVRDAVPSGELIYQYKDKDESITEFATNPVEMTGGVEIYATVVTPSGIEIDLAKLKIMLEPFETVSFLMKLNQGAASLASLTTAHEEDI